MATYADSKQQILDYLASKGGKTTTADLDKFKASIGVEKADPNKTTEGTVASGQMDAFKKSIAEGGTGSQFITAPATYGKGTAPTATAPRVVAPTATPQVDSVKSLQDQLAEAQKRSTISGLDRARTKSLLALEQEQGLVSPQFAGQRSQARATSQRGAKSFAQFMAARGLASSGGAALGETQRLGALQGELGGLRQQEQGVLTNIGQRRTGIETGYQSDVASANANMQVQALQNAINQANIDKQDQASATALERSQFIQTLPQYANDYKALSDQILGDNDPTNDWKSALALTARQEKIASQGLDQQGKAIEEGMISQEAQEALNAYNAGFRTPEVMSILKNAGYEFPTTGGSGKAETVKSTPDQIATYNRYYDNIFDPQGQWGGSRQGVLDVLASSKDILVNAMGQKLYDSMLADAITYDPRVEQPSAQERLAEAEAEKAIAELDQPEPKKPIGASDYKTSPDFADDFSQIEQADDVGKADLYRKLIANSATFIETYGLQGYNELIAATGQEE